MAKTATITTTIELDAATTNNLGPGGGYRQPPTINQGQTSATYPATVIKADRDGTIIRTNRAITINTYPTFRAPNQSGIGTNPTNLTNPTNPTQSTGTNPPAAKDLVITTSIILTFDATGKTVYSLDQPYDLESNIYFQMLIGNWTAYLIAAPKGITNITPYNGALLGENKQTDLNLTDTTITFTTTKVKPTNNPRNSNGILAIWYHDGKPIDKTLQQQLTNQGYIIPPPGNTGYSQSSINLNFTLAGPKS